MGDGVVSILNVGEGDTKLSFDPEKPAERERAARIITDMLRRGYAISLQIGTSRSGEFIYTRATEFDPNTCEYLIENLSPAEEAEIADKMSGKTKRGRKTKIPAAGVAAVAIARTARGCSQEGWA